MKYALIGCGRIAENHIKAAIENNLELTAVCDIDEEHMEELLCKFHLEHDTDILRYCDYKEMLFEHPELELCAIATESGLHAQIALDCMESGVNIMIEKPIAMNMEDAEKIIRKSEEHGIVVSVCHQNRFNEAIQAVRRARETGRFGKLSHGAVHVRWFRDEAYYKQAPWRGTWKLDGGCLMNQCIHGIDLLVWLIDAKPVRVYGVTRQRQHPYLEAEDAGMAIVEFENGVIAEIEGTTNIYRDDLEECLLFCGEKGTVKISGTSANRVDYWEFAEGDNTDREIKTLDERTINIYGNGHGRLYADVISAIKEHRQPCVDAKAGRNALEIVLAIYKSQKTGNPVELPLKNFSSEDMETVKLV
ncbi:Gfo/Idh/MocA family protein [Mediterraneibacter agrestimuris]|uniref:Gfo/Idh/MocA family protein n=1 Tax=Mediterraneibacter agrestimuris TaxID=2941333 RepID=UPI00203AF62D|nr:Gfo/Idh/MocA family oxidoreductase [Mediterraneibacter agrestimuris]